MSKRIIVTVSKDGRVTVEADGFKGIGCEAATKAIRDALGVTAENKRKAEYSMQENKNENRIVR